jgi:hypothetical protein
VATSKGATPFDFVEDCSMLFHQGGVKEELLGEGGLDASNGFPVGWAEVGPERETYLEEQVVLQDVGKCACDIGVVFYLTEAGLNVIGMDNDVVCGVRDPEVVCPGEEFLADVAEFALEF